MERLQAAYKQLEQEYGEPTAYVTWLFVKLSASATVLKAQCHLTNEQLTAHHLAILDITMSLAKRMGIDQKVTTNALKYSERLLNEGMLH